MTIKLVIGGQYGSEGKGSVVQWLAQNYDFDLAIHTGGPNAGHSFIDTNGEKRAMRTLPCTWPYQNTPLYIPSGAIIDIDVLNHELSQLWDWKFRGGVYISPNAAIIEQDAMEAEKSILTGTTGKGIGATRAKECMRTAKLHRDDLEYLYFTDEHYTLRYIFDNPNAHILIESTQGFGLSLDYKYYPYCTSANIMPYQILQDADVPFNSHKVEVWMVIRTFPIRIAGNSGPMYKETSWDILRALYGSHIPTEYTTVTKKVRRVGEFDYELVRDAIFACNPDVIVLTFMDYMFPDIKQLGLTQPVLQYIKRIEDNIGKTINFIGIGTGELIQVF